MKKTVFLMVILMAITLILGACTPDYTWDKDVANDIARLKEAGFETYIENDKETVRKDSDSFNQQLEHDGKDFSIEYVNDYGLFINHYDIIRFTEFKTEKQAKQVYDYYQEISTEQKLVRFGKILITTNSEDAIGLLGYDFK